MPYKIEAKCENCGQTAEGIDELKELFGLRKVSERKTIPQAWCRKCRTSKKD
jgi:hypothetical protein